MIDGKDLVSSLCIKGRKEEKREATSLFLPLPKRLCARQVAFPYSFARKNTEWRLGTSLLRTSFPFRERGKRAEQDHARSSGEASTKSGRTCLQTSYDSHINFILLHNVVERKVFRLEQSNNLEFPEFEEKPNCSQSLCPRLRLCQQGTLNKTSNTVFIRLTTLGAN